MCILSPDLLSSAALRMSLKRGLAGQVLAEAAASEADAATVIDRLAGLRPNAKALDREVQRLRRRRGVVCAAALSRNEGVVVVVRNLRSVTTRAEGTDLFAETALIYSRIEATVRRGSVGYRIWRASFCRHAIERLVERSRVPLDALLLAVMDGEAVHLLDRLARDEVLVDAGDEAISARNQGVWAGCRDVSRVEDDWGLTATTEGAAVPTFSARTFLGPDEMRPTLWLRWSASTQQGDGRSAKA
jgi:hypothetical protein